MENTEIKQHGLRKYFGQPCRIHGCENTKVIAFGFCWQHYKQYKRNQITFYGKILQNVKTYIKNKNHKCKIKDCKKKAETKLFCINHYIQYRLGTLDENGKRLKEIRFTNNKIVKCKMPNCDKISHIKNFCTTHYHHHREGFIDIFGNILKVNAPKTKCKIPSCCRGIGSKGFCHKHYLQFRHGILDIEGNSIRELIKKVPKTIYGN